MQNLILCLSMVALLLSCSKDDEPKTGFTDTEREVLNVLTGTFSGEEYFLEQWFRTDQLNFSPLESPVDKVSLKDGNIKVYGTIHRIQSKAVGGEVIDDYYFYITPTDKLIVMYAYNTDNGYLTEVKETFYYEIESHNRLKLRKYGLTEDNWITYTRQ